MWTLTIELNYENIIWNFRFNFQSWKLLKIQHLLPTLDRKFTKPLLLRSISSYIISLVFSACGGVRSSFPSIHPIIHPSKFLIPEEEDDGRGGGGQMAAAAVYPYVYVIQSCSLWKTPVVLQFAKSYKLISKNKKLLKKKWETREKIFLKQHKKFQIKMKLLINK